MTCLTRLINYLSKAHTTCLGKGCRHREMQAGRGMRVIAESESRTLKLQMVFVTGVIIIGNYTALVSDCTMCDISALISATHLTIKVARTWTAIEIERSNTVCQPLYYAVYTVLKITCYFKSVSKISDRFLKSQFSTFLKGQVQICEAAMTCNFIHGRHFCGDFLKRGVRETWHYVKERFIFTANYKDIIQL